VKTKVTIIVAIILASCAFRIFNSTAHSQDKAATTNRALVHMVLTDQSVIDSDDVPILTKERIKVNQGNTQLRVTHLIPAKGDNAGLQLLVMIDETCDSKIGSNLSELRDFISDQPSTTSVGVAYISNTTYQIAQNFTPDHALAAKAVRLPRGSLSSMDSPYLSLISLVKGWPEQKIRREVLIITDGIDRLRGQVPSFAHRDIRRGRLGSTSLPAGSYTMPSMSTDTDSAIRASQQSGVIVHSIYAPGVGRFGRNAWEVQLGQSGIAKIADQTGGEYFSLGLTELISFKPYLDRLQKILDNQYYLVFQPAPASKAGLQQVNISTDIPNSDIAAADSVWVPATP
jgi:hypothetical protein